MDVRYGVMIIGETGSGKTVCYNLLRDCIIHLAENEEVTDERFRNVDKYVINPKSVSLGELYG